jgi:ribose 1,5-bisphosphokinase
LIVLVGPSGAGKNSLMAYAREQFDADPTVLFVRRAITRRAFLATQAAGLFAVA